MAGLYLGIKTQNPTIGVTSTNPGIANGMAAAQQMAQAQQDQQTAKQVDPRWSNQGPTVVHEMPWHKAHPGLKNVQ